LENGTAGYMGDMADNVVGEVEETEVGKGAGDGDV
jgi:hypothetical protein